jgi:hypothetical protein
MGPLVVMPDIELWAYTYLKDQLATRPEPYAIATVDIKPPPATNLPDRIVWVRRDGGPRLDVVREVPRLTVNVMCKAEQDATDLARLIAALMWAAPDGAPVLKVTQLSGPTPVEDPSKRPRRYMTFELDVRGQQLD